MASSQHQSGSPRPTDDCQGSSPSGFLQLPVEIRHLIYEDVLIRPKVLLPQIRTMRRTGEKSFGLTKNDVHLHPFGRHAHPRYAKTPHPLEEYYTQPWPGPIGLLGGVCKLLHEEAVAVFLGGNQFVFPRGMYDPLIWFGRSYERAAARSRLLRDVSFGFAYDDAGCEPSPYALHSDPAENRATLGLMRAKLPEDPRARADMFEVVWAARIRAIKKLKLNRLRLGFHECLWARTLERKVDWVLERLVHGWDGPRPKIIEISGWQNDDEKAMIEEVLSRTSEGAKGATSIIQFQGDSNEDHRDTGFANIEPDYPSDGSIEPNTDSGEDSEINDTVMSE